MISSDLIGFFLFWRFFFVVVQVQTGEPESFSLRFSKMLNHDRDEELSMFLEMRRREKEHRGESLLTGSSYIYI